MKRETFHRPLLLLQAVIVLGAFAFVLLFERPAAFPVVATTHLVLVIGVMPLIFGAMLHFVPVLTRSGAPSVPASLLPLAALAAGVLVFIAFQGGPKAGYWFVAAAALGLASALALALWIAWRGTECIGSPYPCLYWYLAALACLALALASTFALHLWPGEYLAIKRFHLHLNTLGFVGLTAFGTLHVLLPTVTGRADKGAARRLRQGLPWALAGTLLIAAGAAKYPMLSFLGIVLWAVPVARLLLAWWRLYRSEVLSWHGAAPPLFAAAFGFAVLLVAGALHGARWASAQKALPGFALLFLFPLVTGALTQLFPLWLAPGRRSAWHGHAWRRLGYGSGASALAFLSGGLLVIWGVAAGFSLALTGLAWFVVKLAQVGMQRPRG